MDSLVAVWTKWKCVQTLNIVNHFTSFDIFRIVKSQSEVNHSMPWKANQFARHALESKLMNKHTHRNRNGVEKRNIEKNESSSKMHKISKCIETVISNWCATIKYAANVYALAPEFSFLIALESQKKPMCQHQTHRLCLYEKSIFVWNDRPFLTYKNRIMAEIFYYSEKSHYSILDNKSIEQSLIYYKLHMNCICNGKIK